MLSFQIQKNSSEFLRLSRLYASFRGDDPVLAACPTLEALLAALERSGGADRTTRLRLLCAVVERHKAAPGPLGAAIVLHALRGVLGGLAKSLVGIDRDEADALVVCALVETLPRMRRPRDPAWVVMDVRQETRRALFASLERDARARPYRTDEEEAAAEAELAGLSQDDLAAAADDDLARDDAPSPEDDPAELGKSRHRPRWVDLDTLVDPASLVPIEERLDAKEPTASSISDEQLLRAHAVRGGLRRLTRHLFADASARQREHEYRQLLRRAQKIVARRK